MLNVVFVSVRIFVFFDFGVSFFVYSFVLIRGTTLRGLGGRMGVVFLLVRSEILWGARFRWDLYSCRLVRFWVGSIFYLFDYRMFFGEEGFG